MKFYRTQGILDLEKVQKTKLGFIGLGSLGSLVLANLAYPWREIVLVDPDELSLHNVERHLLGLKDVGKPKIEGMKDYLLDKGYSGKMTLCPEKAEAVLDAHPDIDLLIVSIDRRLSRDNLNSWCFKNNKPALYSGIYPKGTGGHIMVVPTPTEQCYICAEKIMGGSYDEDPQDVDYGIDITQLTEKEGQREIPVLRPAIDLLASLIAGYVLDFVHDRESLHPGIQVFIGSSWEGVLKLFPKDLEVVKKYIDYQPNLGLVPNLRITEKEDTTQLELRNTSVCIALEQWKDCHFHSRFVSLSEIYKKKE